MKNLYTMPDNIQTRWASPENWDAMPGKGGQAKNGRKGSASFPLNPGESRVLAHADGTGGTIHRIWMTLSDRSPQMLRGMRLEMFWDNAKSPAVSAPLGDFFCQGLGRAIPFESALFSNPEGRSFNCYVPMPFGSAMKIVLTNETNAVQPSVYYDVNYTIGDTHADDILYFHAHYRRENPTRLTQDYSFLPKVEGIGRFLGVNAGVICDTGRYFNSGWNEGECKIYLDGDKDFPTLCGTGTEDYMGTGWGQGQFANLYQGCHLVDWDKFHFCFYRYHIVDPIYFHRNIRVTMQQIGCWGPDHKSKFHKAGRPVVGLDNKPIDFSRPDKTPEFGGFEREDDWSSCAYFYLNKPANDLPSIDPIEKRLEGISNNPDKKDVVLEIPREKGKKSI